MIYLFAGSDSKKKIASYASLAKTLPKDLEIFVFSKNDFNHSVIEGFCSGAGLFFTKCAVVLRGVFEENKNEELALDQLEQMQNTENLFIFIEGNLNKKVIDLFKKVGADICVSDLPKEKLEKFNNFLLANAFGARDKKNLWLYYRQAIDIGVAQEELVGVLFWKVKDMIFKKNFLKFKEKELKDIASNLSYLLPKSREQGKDSEVVLERFLLESF